ncbi:hypothetical protein ACROYT_G020946 [Oculina patagonica]
MFVIYGTLTIIKRDGIAIKFELSSNRGTHTIHFFNNNTFRAETEQENGTLTSGLNVHIWYDFCPSSIQVICYHPLFPKAPDEKAIITTLDVTRTKDNYVQRIFGFIHPPKTGKYKFAIASDDFSELWLSPSEDPSKAVLICSVEQWSTRDNFQQSPAQVSREIELKEGRKYFVELIHVQMKGDDFLQLVWSTPGMPRSKFETISINSMALFDKDNGTLYNYDTAPDSPACKSRPHHRHSSRTEVKSTPLYLPHETVKDALPYCDYKPSYLTIKDAPDGRPKQFYDFLSDHFIPIGSYPAAEHKTVINEFPAFGNHHLDAIKAREAARIYVDGLHQHYPGKFEVLELVNVERKIDKQLGSRFLLEFLVNITGRAEPVMLSESVFWPKDANTLCYPKGLQWNRNAKIALVITLRNQGRWMVHFLNNLEEMYAVTKDENVSLLIFNYNSSDINLEHELALRKLPSYTVINHQAEHYSRTRSFNRAVEQVHDPHTIVFTLDLHLDLPNTLFDDIRKHCFEGRSVYTPVIIRLDCGEPPATLKGRWEPQGFGLVGIFKSDWDRIGGFNEKAFDEKWGGEDWDLMERLVSFGMEYDRVRHPRIFHYYHSRHGMWTFDQDASQ